MELEQDSLLHAAEARLPHLLPDRPSVLSEKKTKIILMLTKLTTSSMLTYEEVLNLAHCLTADEQYRLLEALSGLVHYSAEVEGEDEIVFAQEIAESDIAWQAYQSRQDPGLSSEELKLRLFGKTIG